MSGMLVDLGVLLLFLVLLYFFEEAA